MRHRFPLIAAVALALVAGCSGGGGGAAARGAKARLLVRNNFEALLNRDDKGGYRPWLASSYEVSPDGRTCTVELRTDVTFSEVNGPATAVYHLKRPDVLLLDRVLVMRDGAVVESGTAGDVSGRPRHEYTRALLDAVPSLEVLPR